MTATLGSMLLSSTHPRRLRDWYATAFSAEVESTPGEPSYDVLNFGGFYVLIDTRADISDSNPDPARLILNFDVSDARGVAARISELGSRWIAELEDREGSLFATAVDPDGNYVQIIQMSEAERAAMTGE